MAPGSTLHYQKRSFCDEAVQAHYFRYCDFPSVNPYRTDDGSADRVIMMLMSDKGLEPVYRPLTEHERELVAWLIEHGTSQEQQQLYFQLPRLSVRERCTCGCPTVYFALDGAPVPRKGERLISDHLASVNGMDVGIMLFETDGILSSLEVYSCPGTDEQFGLPKVASIRPL